MKKIFLCLLTVFVIAMPLSVLAESVDDISNLTSTYENDAVALKWSNPDGVESITIYRDGSLLTIMDKDSTVYYDTDIQKDKSYSYLVTVDLADGESDGMETTIKTVSGASDDGEKSKVDETTDPVTEEEEIIDEEETVDSIDGLIDDELPESDGSIAIPGNVVFLKAEKVTADSVHLSWENPVESDLTQINLYQDGKLIKSLPLISEFTVKGLAANHDYVFSVSVVDADEYEGPKMSVVATTLLGTDNDAPATVKGIEVIPSNSNLYVKWLANKETDLAGYNVYINGVKSNSTTLKNLFYSVSSLENGVNYNVAVTAVDQSGNESEIVASYGIPLGETMAEIGTDYSLSDVSSGVEKWFSSYWVIIAFAISVPLTFYVSARIKLLFLD